MLYKHLNRSNSARKNTLIPTSLAAKAQRRAYRAHFTDLHNSRVKVLLPGKQNDDLWNGWCVLLSPPPVCFVRRWRQRQSWSLRPSSLLIQFFTPRFLTLAYLHPRTYIYTRTNFTQTAHKHHQCNHGNQGSSASGEGVVLRTLFCVASKMKPDRRSVRVAAKPTLCFSRLCVCVCVLLAWQRDSRQECRTGCRKKIPETVKSMPKTPWGCLWMQRRSKQTLNSIPQVQFTLAYSLLCPQVTSSTCGLCLYTKTEIPS